MNCDELEKLISAYVDGELLQFDAQRVENHVADCPRCAATLAEYRKMAGEMKGLRFREPDDEELKKARPQVVVKVTRGAGWLLTIGFAVAWLLLGAYLFLTDPEPDTFVKVMVMGLILGFVLLLVSVLHERLVERKADRYKEIQK